MDALGDFIAKRKEVGETKVSKHPEKSIWLTCRTCRPERWVCTVCRKRKKFPTLCPVRQIVLNQIESSEMKGKSTITTNVIEGVRDEVVE